MITYFVEGNEHATEEDILGHAPRVRKSEGVEVTFIDEGQEKHPPTTSGSGTSRGSRSPMLSRNKVGPTNGSVGSKLIWFVWLEEFFINFIQCVCNVPLLAFVGICLVITSE